MKTKQVNPMPAVVGRGFDCELKGITVTGYKTPYFPYYSDRAANLPKSEHKHLRPRLNNPQVLPDWGWLDSPLLDGFVWDCRYIDAYNYGYGSSKANEYPTEEILQLFASREHELLDLACIGVQKGSQLEDWAIENDVPIYNDDMEVDI